MDLPINQIVCGDCLEAMKDWPDDSIDSIVTDPPYGWSFMGKKWDYDIPSVEVWKECLRVLKPGGHALIACGTRTQHRMACNIEDAGFEIRDLIAWVYGSGFPKSLDISKAIDKQAGAKRCEVGNKSLGVDGRKRNPNIHLPHKETGHIGKWGFETSGYAQPITIPASDAAQQWQGWGTALKPAMELWTLARKSLSEKTVAANVLKWGTGGINVDGGRVTLNGEKQPTGSAKRVFKCNQFTDEKVYGDNKETPKQGRFPANLIHDGSDEVLGMFPNSKSGAMKKPYKYTNNGYSLGKPTGETKQIHESSEGSAARFFYCAKASKAERNRGLEGIEEKPIAYSDYRENVATTKSFVSEYPDGKPRPMNKPKNNHPTVKPIALMRYLCRLITPPEGIVLDNHAGSGSTCIAALKEGFKFIGIDDKEDYCNIAEARIREARAGQKALFDEPSNE